MKWAWLDDKLVSKSGVLISAFDEGFLYGAGLFETMRVSNGKIFALGRHIRRLQTSSPVIGLKPPSESSVRKAIVRMIKKNGLRQAALRVNYFKKEKGAGLFIFAREWSLPSFEKYARGFSVVLEKKETIGATALSGVKSLNRLFYQRLSVRARALGFDEALFLNAKGEVVEGTRTNVFLVKGGQVATPALICGCLPGVTRDVVIKILKRLGVAVRERRVLARELYAADEIFVTNSLLGIMPVTHLDKKSVGKGNPGVWCEKITALYKKEVEKERLLR